MEVPEERDYYPYWGPTPWKDIAILVSDGKTEELMKRYVNSSNYGLKCKAYHQQYSIMIVLYSSDTYFLLSILDMCIMPKGLKDQTDCPPDNQGVVAEKCVAKYITRDRCIAAKGPWQGSSQITWRGLLEY